MPTLPQQRRHTDEYDHLEPLFHQLHDSQSSEARRRIREELVTGHLPLANHLARKFANRGQPADDLEQVARLGLIAAIDRFDPERGCVFLSFAVPTITGELQRYFRDVTWSVSLPRSLQERSRAVLLAAEELGHELGSSPRPSHIAQRLGIPVAEVYEGLQAGLAYRSASLDRVTENDEGQERPALPLATADPDLELVDDRVTLYRALGCLSTRDASIVIMRFFGDMTQAHIARRVGLSQMQISRILDASLARLRDAFTRD